MRKIFLSYTTLLHRLADKTISSIDLEDALFSFGCSRLHVFRDIQKHPAEYEYLRVSKEKQKEINNIIINDISKAANDNRVIWCRDSDYKWNSARVEFLANHGIQVDIECDQYQRMDGLNIPGWKEFLKDKLECIG